MTLSTIPNRILHNGVSIPQLGFGVFKVDPATAETVVADAFEAGYRHIDTATIYGNEAGVGRALAASGLRRDDVFLTTKLWNDDQGADTVEDAFAASLDRLGVDAVDLYLIHWPCPARNRYVESWRVLHSIAESGRARAIGVSNFEIEHLERLHAETGVVPAVNQIELHPYFQRRELVTYCQERGIAIQAWGPLSQGKSDLLAEPTIVDAAAQLGKTPAQVVLRWHIEQGTIVFPKTVRPERARENIALFDFELTAEQHQAVTDLERNLRLGSASTDVN